MEDEGEREVDVQPEEVLADVIEFLVSPSEFEIRKRI
jgi:hypothetical protein